MEAHLLQAGAGVDVIGKRLQRIPVGVQDAVQRSHPRMDMKVQLCQCLRMAATQSPNSRMGLYVKRFGFIELVQNAPEGP